MRMKIAVLWQFTAAFFLAAPGAGAQASDILEKSVRFDVAAQALPSALIAFSTQSGVQVATADADISRLKTNGVNGTRPVGEALEMLLRGTSLKFGPVGANTIAIVEAETVEAETAYPANGPAPGAAMLPQPHTLSLARVDDSSSGAQEKNPPGPAAQSPANMLEEIVVTARRREEKAQTVPVAITVISQQTLQDNNVATIGDLQYLVPSMSANPTWSRDSVNVNLRGQGSKGSSRQGVIAYLNEVPIPTNNAGETAGGPGLLFDLENVQVLKGPQGTLFGRSSVGGALLLQSARPKDAIGGRIQLGYGNHNNREIDAAFDLPVVPEKLLTRVAFNGQRRDGFTQLLGEPSDPNGIDADARDNWSVRGTVTFRPTDRVQNETIATYQEYDSHDTPFILTEVNPNGLANLGGFSLVDFFPTLPALLAQQQALGIRKALAIDTDIDSRGSNFALSNITRIELTDTLALRNIFGYDEAKFVTANDFDSTVLPILSLPASPEYRTVRQFTEEVQLLGNSFAGRLEWIAGGFYLSQPFEDEFARTTSLTFGAPSESLAKDRDRSKALFAQATYDLAPLLSGLSATAGARYTWDEFAREEISNNTVLPPKRGESEALTWTLGLDYQASPGTLLYLASRRGYRPGGSNTAPAPAYDPEYVTDYELGVKSDWTLATLPIRTNAAIYYQDYTDIQTQQLSLIDGVFTAFTGNGADGRVWGAELEAQIQLTRDLQLGVHFDRLKYDYTDFSPDVVAAGGIPQLELDRTFSRPPYKYGVSVRYNVPLAPRAGELALQANWNWQASGGDRLLNVGGLVPAFGLLNLSANWDGIAGKPIDVSVFASNLTDETYHVYGLGGYELIGFSGQRYGEPRMYGVRLRYRFGAH